MAFTAAQEVKIREYLGVPDLFRYRDSRLEDAIKIVGSHPESQAAVEAILAKIAGVEESLQSALATAGMKRAEDVEWYRAEEIESKRTEGRRHCARLSQFLGVPILSDAFGTQGYVDDEWMGVENQYGGLMSLG